MTSNKEEWRDQRGAIEMTMMEPVMLQLSNVGANFASETASRSKP